MLKRTGLTQKLVDREDERMRGLPTPTTRYRRRAWLEFQRALDPLDALEEPGRDFRAGDRDPYGLERLPRLQAEPVGGGAKRGLDRLGRERLERRERGGCGLEHRAAAVQLRCVRRDVVEEEAGERGELAEALD